MTLLTFNDMLQEIQRDENIEPIQNLVSDWIDANILIIQNEFQDAWSEAKLESKDIVLPGGITNQSRGTKLWKEVEPLLAEKMNNLSFDKCKKSGYPDRQLVHQNGQKYAFEQKAHSKWEITDGNRIVICSSTDRLRSTFREPIFHIWATLYHSVRNSETNTICQIHALDLHFIEPTTIVNRRLEVSSSNKLLHESVENEYHTKIRYGSLNE